MAVAEEIQILINAKVDAAVRDLKKVQGETGKTENSAAKMAKAFAKQTLAAAGVAVSIGAVVKTLRESVQAYGVQIQAENSLAAAIRTTGGDVDDLLPRYKDLASEIQNVTTVGDEETLGLIALGKQMGITDDQLEEATKGAIGLSKAFGIDAQTAMRGVANALEGNFSQLSRYIPALRTTNDEAEQLAIVQRAMANGFEVAKSEAESGYGALLQYQNAVGDLREELGRVVVEGAKPFISALTDFATRTVNAIGEARKFENMLNEFKDSGEVTTSSIEDMNESIVRARRELGSLEGLTTGDQERAVYLNEYIQALEAQITTIRIVESMQRRYAGLAEDERKALELNKEAAERNAEALDELNKRKFDRLSDDEKRLQNLQTEFDRLGDIRNRLRETGQEYGVIQQLLNDINAEMEALQPVSEDTIEELIKGKTEIVALGEDYLSQLQQELSWLQFIEAETNRLEDFKQAARDKELADLEELERQVLAYANAYSGAFQTVMDVLRETGDVGQALWEGIKEGAKETGALILESLAKEAAARAALAFATGNFVQGGAFTAAASTALAGAAFVRAFRSGGVVNEPVVGTGQNTGRTYTFAENGPERVQPSARGGDSMHIVINLDGKPILDTIQRASRTGRLLIDARSVV